ncbi:MAG: hypothetical protein JST40_11090 [Armatimonadetes bacterium]|nr:hypothetical protein [Armatimonadota bacterium]
MSQVQRRSDVVETYSVLMLQYGIGGVVAVLLGGLMVYYRGMLMYLGILLLLAGLAALGYAIFCYNECRKVPPGTVISCPYCHAKNTYTDTPADDQTCTECHRLMPIVEGRVLRVSQVRCGFCNTLNYYSEKSVGLICESCDREIPIAVAEGQSGSAAAHTYSFKQDTARYDLVLREGNAKSEQLIQHLQHLLALNRNQVKEILGNLPATLLTGIPRMKAEMLQKDLSHMDAVAEFSESRPG